MFMKRTYGYLKSVPSNISCLFIILITLSCFLYSFRFISRILANPTGFLDVQFDINRLVYERMHKAVDLCSVEEKLNILFPTVEKNKPNRNKRFKLTERQYVSIYLINI